MHYEPGYAYPLLVWLHGDVGSERELRQLMPHVSLRNYVAVAARGVGSEKLKRTCGAWPQSSEAVAEATERVRQCVEGAKERFNVHASRVFIAGRESGGTMALRVALRTPREFAGALSLGGPMPQGHSPLRQVNEARRLPLWLGSSRHSRDYPQAQVAADLRLLHSAGFTLSIHQYPGDCDLTTVMLSDMDRWIMQRVCAPATAT